MKGDSVVSIGDVEAVLAQCIRRRRAWEVYSGTTLAQIDLHSRNGSPPQSSNRSGQLRRIGKDEILWSTGNHWSHELGDRRVGLGRRRRDHHIPTTSWEGLQRVLPGY